MSSQQCLFLNCSNQNIYVVLLFTFVSRVPPISLHMKFLPVACSIHSVHNADDTNARLSLMNCGCHLLTFLILLSGCNASKKQSDRTSHLQTIENKFILLFFTKYFSVIGWTYRVNGVEEKRIRNVLIAYRVPQGLC